MIQSLERRVLFVGYNDLLLLAQNYGQGDKTWQPGDSNSAGSVNFDDLLRLAQDYGSGPYSSFAEDWARSLSMTGQPLPYSTARVVDKTLEITTGTAGDIHLRATESRSGRLRIYGSDTSFSQRELISVKSSNVRSIRIVDGDQSHSITLDPNFPAAKVILGAGNDRLVASNAANTIHGGAGDDTIYAGGGDDVVYGEAGIDFLFGEGGSDHLDGGAHKDFLDGGIGRNRLIGGQGTDYFSVRAKDKLIREDRDRVKVID